MNAHQKLFAVAGQKTHEKLYGAQFLWKGNVFPCTHDDIVKNPPLITGGFSPDTQTTVTVRTDLFPVGGNGLPTLPRKGDKCQLQPNPEEPSVIGLRIATTMTSVGDLIQKFLCVDENQSA